MKFSAQMAMAYAHALARPRSVGTAQEASTVAELARRLEGSGLHSERQPFLCSTALDVALSALLVIGALLIAVSMVWRASAPRVAGAASLALLALIGLANPLLHKVQDGAAKPTDGSSAGLWNRFCLRLGARFETCNLVARLPGEPTSPHLYLVAHYDSKSQRLPLALRIGLFALAAGGGSAFAMLTLLAGALPLVEALLKPLGVAALLANLALLWRGSGNQSPGAIDNASGVGLVLHLVEVLGRRSPAVNLTVVLTGAEELGALGAVAFVKHNQARLQEQALGSGVAILNFDGPGVDGKLTLVANRRGRLLTLVREVCQRAGIPVSHRKLFGALLDHQPFTRQGFDALSLVSVGWASLAVHSRKDGADKLHPAGFERAGRVALGVIERLGMHAPPAHNPESDSSLS